jgi:tetratricopeptide (TPR) repeat protein
MPPLTAYAIIPPMTIRSTLAAILVTASAVIAGPPQGGRGGPGSELIRQGTQQDLQGNFSAARKAFQEAIDTAATPSATAQAQRAMAMSYGFEGDCANTIKYEMMVVDYWKTRETAEPANAFYQQGEMANEAGRICIDAGDLDRAEKMYRLGRELGLKEPNITSRKPLWEFRTEHALARLAARRNQPAEARKHVELARAALDEMKAKDAALYQQQQSFLPYLTGYVAYYAGDYQKALEDLQRANTNDPFIQCMIGMTYEKLGQPDKAKEQFGKAATAGAHNPPAAFARRFTRSKG